MSQEYDGPDMTNQHRRSRYYNPNGVVTNASFVQPDYQSRRNAEITQGLAGQQQPQPNEAQAAGNATLQQMQQQQQANVTRMTQQGKQRDEQFQFASKAGMLVSHPIFSQFSRQPIQSVQGAPAGADVTGVTQTENGVEIGSLDHYRQAKVAEAAGIKSQRGGGSLFDLNTVHPDSEIYMAPGKASKAELAQYRNATQALTRSLSERFAQYPDRFQSIEQLDDFIKADPNHSDTLGRSAQAIGEDFLAQYNPELYKQLTDKRLIERTNKQAESDYISQHPELANMGPEAQHNAYLQDPDAPKYQTDPVTGQPRPVMPNPEQIANKKARLKIQETQQEEAQLHKQAAESNGALVAVRSRTGKLELQDVAEIQEKKQVIADRLQAKQDAAIEKKCNALTSQLTKKEDKIDKATSFLIANPDMKPEQKDQYDMIITRLRNEAAPLKQALDKLDENDIKATEASATPSPVANEPTATGPNGEKKVFRNGAWTDL